MTNRILTLQQAGKLLGGKSASELESLIAKGLLGCVRLPDGTIMGISDAQLAAFVELNSSRSPTTVADDSAIREALLRALASDLGPALRVIVQEVHRRRIRDRGVLLDITTSQTHRQLHDALGAFALAYEQDQNLHHRVEDFLIALEAAGSVYAEGAGHVS